jgi:hypothetical protein
MSWSPIEFYYKHGLSGLVATSAATGYPVSNILQPVDGTLWKATSTATQYITFDAGVGNTYSPDYLLIHNHNLFTAGATVVLQYSTDNFAADTNDIFTAFAPSSDKSILKLFTTQAKRYWRLKISGATVVPWIAYARWGAREVLDFADELTPYNVERKANVNVGDAGYVQGIHEKYAEWGLKMQFQSADSTLLGKLRTWEETMKLGLFGVSWDPGDHSTDVRVMRRKGPSFTAPLQYGGAYADVSLDLIGRVE